MIQILDEFIQQLTDIVVEEIRHQDYKRVTKLAKMYYSFITGEGLDEMMKKFSMREADDAFEQRKMITEHVIPSVVSNITSVERKVPRSNGMTRIVAYKDDEKFKQAEKLEEILDVFWGDLSFDNWMSTRWIELNDIDPNTFVIIEWQAFDEKVEKATPYPYESKAAEAIMFEYDNNILQYLVDKKDEVYTMYLMNQTIQAVLLDEDNPVYGSVTHTATEKGEIVEVDGRLFFKKTDKAYYEIVTFEPHNLDKVPAFRVGYKRDDVTDGRTYVCPYHEAVPYLNKTLKANSELDLTMALHAFPQKIIMANACSNLKCFEGYIRDGETKTEQVCSHCQGTGFDIHTSAQDVIIAQMPRGKDEQLSLDNLAKYLTPEVELLEFQRLYIEYLTNECMQAVFNSDIFTREEVATTATEKRIDLDNIYDTLYPLSLKYAKVWKFGVELIAEVTSLDNNLIAIMSFSKDFKFKSKDDYIRDRAAAKDAGTPDAILRNIDDEIMKIDTSENPLEFSMYKTIQSFDPFTGKTDEEIITAMVNSNVPMEIKVLYDNLGWIFDEILMEHTDFFNLNRKKQSDIVKKKVQEIMAQIQPDVTELPTGALAAGVEGEPDLAAEAKAKLKGTVGGVQGILSINESIQQGVMSKEAGKALLMEIYGFDPALAERLIKEPDKKKLTEIAETNVPKPSPNQAPVN